MRLARVIAGCGCAAVIAGSAAAAQEEHGLFVGVAVGGIYSSGALMPAAQLSAQIPLANPNIQLRFAAQYGQSSTTSGPGPGARACPNPGCNYLTSTDELMALTTGARFDIPKTDHHLYCIATTGVYQWRVSSNAELDPHASATGVALGGGFGGSVAIGSARLFAEAQMLLGTVARGAYERTEIFPVTVGVRF
jgi:hypothetical protein